MSASAEGKPDLQSFYSCRHSDEDARLSAAPHAFLFGIQGFVRGKLGGCGKGLRDAAHTRLHQLLWPAALWQRLLIYPQAGAHVVLLLSFHVVPDLLSCSGLAPRSCVSISHPFRV